MAGGFLWFGGSLEGGWLRLFDHYVNVLELTIDDAVGRTTWSPLGHELDLALLVVRPTRMKWLHRLIEMPSTCNPQEKAMVFKELAAMHSQSWPISFAQGTFGSFLKMG